MSGTSLVSLVPLLGMMFVFGDVFGSCVVNSVGIKFLDVECVDKGESRKPVCGLSLLYICLFRA